MSFTPVAPFSLTTYSASTTSTAAADYKTAIDNNFVVAQRQGAAFAVSEQSPAASRNMTVHVSAGWLFDGVTMTEVAAQDTGVIVAPVAAPRIDRVVAQSSNGTVLVLTGTEAAAPTAPSVSTSYIPLAQLYLAIGTTVIGNSMLTDERAVWGAQFLPADYQEFTSTGSTTWNKPTGLSSNALVIAMVWGAGGGGTTGAGGGVGGAGGGGGSCSYAVYRAVDLSSAVTVVVPPGGLAETVGSPGQFGSQLAYGGGGGNRGPIHGGGGGGWFTAGDVNGNGGDPLGFSAKDSIFGGGGDGGGAGIFTAMNSVYGGGGGIIGSGSTASIPTAGRSFYGGGGGAGWGLSSAGSTVFSGVAGQSVMGGNGGTRTVAASAPGGGGGGTTGGALLPTGARGEVRVWTLRG